MATHKKKALVISFSPIERDPRVLRQIKWLERDFEVSVIGYGNSPKGIELRQFYELKNRKLTRLFQLQDSLKRVTLDFESYYWAHHSIKSAFSFVATKEFDLIVCNDIETLPIGHALRNDFTKLIFDAHEYAPLHFENSIFWNLTYRKYVTNICKKYIPFCDAAITVSPGLAQGYSKFSKHTWHIITNAPTYHDLKPSKVGDKIKLIHHGLAVRARKIEKMINLAKFLDRRFEVYFMLLSSSRGYLDELKSLASKFPNVFFINPVDVQEIPSFINQFDIGLFLTPPSTYNLKHTLPNKLFEYIQGRLALGIGPSPDMKQVVRNYDIGVVSNDFEERSLANALNMLDKDEITRLKYNAAKAAQIECAENNEFKFQAIYTELLRA